MEGVKTIITLFGDLVAFIWLTLRPQSTLAAENLFLRKQLAMFQERKAKPRRPDTPTRIALVLPGGNSLPAAGFLPESIRKIWWTSCSFMIHSFWRLTSADIVDGAVEQLFEGKNPVPVIQPENSKHFMFQLRQLDFQEVAGVRRGGMHRAPAEAAVKGGTGGVDGMCCPPEVRSLLWVSRLMRLEAFPADDRRDYQPQDSVAA
jgi:hypothetical protein